MFALLFKPKAGKSVLRLFSTSPRLYADCTGDSKTMEEGAKKNEAPFVPNPDVPGLSNKVIQVPDHPVGPGASKSGVYKNPEYFCYHPMSFYDAFFEIERFQLPQPNPYEKEPECEC